MEELESKSEENEAAELIVVALTTLSVEVLEADDTVTMSMPVPVSEGDKESDDQQPLDDTNITTETETHKDDKDTEEGEEEAEEGELADTTLSDQEDHLDPATHTTKEDLDAVDGGAVGLENFVIEPKELECQFFGSFYNEKQLREPVIDLVSFATPCKVSEIRIIPLGATVEMLDGVALLGSTNPTNFDLEFYYEDLTDPAHATFKEITKFTYDHKLAVHFSCGTDDPPIITNKVLVRGIYNSITLAVIGHEVNNFPVRTVLEHVDQEALEYDVGSEGSFSGSDEDDEVEYYSDEDDEDRDSYDDEDAYSQYSDEYELENDQQLEESDSYYYDSEEEVEEEEVEEADDDVEMKDAFDPSLDDEEFQEQSPSPPVSPGDQDAMNPSPSPSWEDENREEGEEDDSQAEYEKTRSPYEDQVQSKEQAGSVSPDDHSVEQGHMGTDVENNTQQSEEHEFQIDTQIVEEKETESPVEEEKELKVTNDLIPVQSTQPPTPSPPIVPLQLDLDMEDISDGDISSLEDFGQAESDEQVPASLPKSVSSVLQSPSAGLAPTGRSISETKTNEMLSEHEFEDDFEDDLEVISDEEIRDESETEMGDYEDTFPDVYGRPYDQESFHLYRPQNYRVELYPKTFVRHDNPLKEKLTEALRNYAPGTFKVDMLEGWVEVMEEVLPILTPCLRSIPPTKMQATNNTLLFWVEQSFQLEPTTSPESVTRNLRQLKVALKLVFFLCEFEPNLSRAVAQLQLGSQTTTVQEKLAETLLGSAIPAVKCLCAKALEATLNTRTGYESLVAKKCLEMETSGYERMLSSLIEVKLKNLVLASIRPLFQRVSLLTVLLKLTDGTADDLDAVLINLRDMLDRVEEIELGAYNTKLTSSLITVENVVSGYLPAYDARVSFVKVLKETGFLDSCSKLMSNPKFNSNYKLLSLLVRIFEILLKWEVGILYLAEEFPLELLQSLSKPDVPHSPGVKFATYFSQCVTVLKCVDVASKKLRNLSPTEVDAVIDALLETYILISYESGRKAITHVLTTGDFIQPLLDCVKFAETSIVEGDKIKNLEKTAIGGYAVELLVHVVRTADNVTFLSVHGDDICRLYDSLREDFVGYLKLSEVLPFMRPARIGKNFTVDGVAEICEQLRKLTEENLLKCKGNCGLPPEMVTYLRMLDNLAISSFERNSFNSDSARNNDLEGIRVEESIHYKLACVYMNSADILSTLAGILIKLTEEYNQPAVHAHTFIHSKGEALTALILPTVRILRKLLTELILIRHRCFRDLTLVPILLRTFALVDSFPETCTALETVAKIKVHLIACLQAYTIPVMKVGDASEEELMNSIWTRMMMELISFTMTSPCNFIPGMKILSELQPLKLPLISTQELSEGTKARLISLRKLWSAFLHGVTTPLQEMLGILCESTTRELVILVKRVCLQIADLSAASCLVVCRGIMEPILSSIEADLEENSTPSQGGGVTGNSVTAWVEGSHDRRNIQCSPRTARLLGFLNSLIRKSGNLKAGVLQVMKGSSKVDEKFSEFLTLLGSILTSSHSSPEPKPSAAQVKTQGHVMSIFHTLCNPRVNLFIGNGSGADVDGEYVKANSLPPKDAMSLICTSLLSFLSGQEDIPGNVTVIRKIFYALKILCETEYGFYHLRTGLSKSPALIHELILKLKTTELEALDIVGVMESMEVIDGVLSFLRNLITPQQKRGGMEPRRTILSKLEVCKLLGWSSPVKPLNHPLVQLCDYLSLAVARNTQSEGCQEGNEEQLYLKTYMGEAKEKLDKVLTFLDSPGGESQWSLAEVVLSPPDSLQDQFSRRPVVVPAKFQDSSQGLDYLSQIGLGADDVDFEFSTDDLIARDLVATVKEYSKETEAKFTNELEKFCNLKRAEEPSTAKVNGKEDLTYRDLHGGRHDFGSNSASQRSTTSTLSSPGGKPSFLRGAGGNAGRHGFGRGGMNNRPFSFDPFRSRPPNTSRPPSLHVDDFVAMESSSQGSSGSTRGRNSGSDGGYRGRGARGTPSPLSRSFGQSDRGGRGYRSSQGSSGSSYYSARNEPSPRGRPLQRGRGYAGGGDHRWQNHAGGNDGSGSQGSNYGRQDERDSNYGERRSYGGAGRGSGYRDQRGMSSTPGGGSNSSQQQQQQRWRNNPGKFNR